MPTFPAVGAPGTESVSPPNDWYSKLIATLLVNHNTNGTLNLFSYGIYPVTDPLFGAVHDGVTDDTAAIQAAFDYAASHGGGGVFCPSGTYIVYGTILPTDYNNIRLLALSL